MESQRNQPAIGTTAVASSLTLLGSAILCSAAAATERGPVKPDELGAIIDRAEKLVVLDSPRSDAAKLFESGLRRDLDALKAATRVTVPEGAMHCMCIGSPAIDLYEKGQRILRITNHHARLLRCDLWTSDAPIADPEVFLKWFDERKVTGPRAEWDDSVRRQHQHDADLQRWREAMPTSLRPLWHPFENSLDADVEPLDRAVTLQFPSEPVRIRALLGWYGTGAGPWSGFPAYEEVGEKLLLLHSTVAITHAIDGEKLTAAQLEGVARLFGGWEFSQARPGDLRLLTPALKRRLLDHSLESSDDDKRSRAQRAFGG